LAQKGRGGGLLLFFVLLFLDGALLLFFVLLFLDGAIIGFSGLLLLVGAIIGAIIGIVVSLLFGCAIIGWTCCGVVVGYGRSSVHRPFG